MHYKILKSSVIAWKDKLLYAKRTRPFPEKLATLLWNALPIPYQPDLEFKVDSTAPLPDLLETGAVLWLISPKLLDLFRRWQIVFESFPVHLIDSNSSQPINAEYALFHLMKIHPIVDREKSDIKPDHSSFKNLVLTALDNRLEYALVRDAFLRSLVFVREDLLAEMIRMNITGYSLAEVHQYHFSLRIDR